MMQLPTKPIPMPSERAVYKCGDGWYSGWTGKEYFGVIRPVRGGWALTCWAQVLAFTFGNANAVIFTDLQEAIRELDSLMDVAEKLGRW